MIWNKAYSTSSNNNFNITRKDKYYYCAYNKEYCRCVESIFNSPHKGINNSGGFILIGKHLQTLGLLWYIYFQFLIRQLKKNILTSFLFVPYTREEDNRCGRFDFIYFILSVMHIERILLEKEELLINKKALF